MKSPYATAKNTVVSTMVPGSCCWRLASQPMQELISPMTTNHTTPLRLMAILAHPDDESLGNGGTLARYAAEGVEVTLITATRGQRGWFGDPKDNPGLDGLGKIREAELRAA